MLCAICSNFLQYFKTRKISMVPLCYVMSRASFVQLQWLLFHSISAKPSMYLVFASFSCIAFWCWLDVWFARLAIVPLFACSSTRSVRLVMAHSSKYSYLLYEVFFAFRIWNEFCLFCQPKVCFIGLWDNSRSNSMLLLNTARNCIK